MHSNNSATPAAESLTISSFVGEFALLSNFATLDEPLSDADGLSFASAEHAFQGAKTCDLAERQRVAAAATPGQAKRLGHTLILRRDWDQVRVEIMASILAAKFAQPRFRAVLLSTGEAQLVEGNRWHDTFWGVCVCSRHDGAGENALGKLLMDLRARLCTGVAGECPP